MNHHKAQAYFDTALAGLRKQGRKSADHGVCVYRGPSDCRCAIGFLIPDDKYTPNMETFRAGATIILDAVDAPVGFGPFLIDMQKILHDTIDEGAFLRDLERNARYFAYHYELDYSPPETAA